MKKVLILCIILLAVSLLLGVVLFVLKFRQFGDWEARLYYDASIPPYQNWLLLLRDILFASPLIIFFNAFRKNL